MLSRRTMLLAGGAALAVPVLGARAAAADYGEIAQRFAQFVRADYFDPKKAKLIAQRIESGRAQYGFLRNPELFAKLLTVDAHGFSGDKNFNVYFDPARANAKPGPIPSTPQAPSAEELQDWKARDFDVTLVETMRGNIGRILIDGFLHPWPAVTQRYATAMEQVKGTDALLIDLRRNTGGDPQMTARFASYFFDRPPFVINRVVRRGRSDKSFRTTAHVEGPSYGATRPVFVLVSGETTAGGEEFAYDLQALKRARIVGQKTRGSARSGSRFDLGQGFVAFIPDGHVVNPVTGTNWQDTGVRPDVVTTADETLDKAHALALATVSKVKVSHPG